MSVDYNDEDRHAHDLGISCCSRGKPNDLLGFRSMLDSMQSVWRERIFRAILDYLNSLKRTCSESVSKPLRASIPEKRSGSLLFKSWKSESLRRLVMIQFDDRNPSVSPILHSPQDTLHMISSSIAASPPLVAAGAGAAAPLVAGAAAAPLVPGSK